MREQILNTPFWIVGTQEQGYHITWGKYRFNEDPIPDNTDLDLQQIGQDWVLEHQWDIIMHLIAVGVASYHQQKDQ